MAVLEFAYYSEHGERGDNPPLRYGEGLTSKILQTREPMLLNRAEAFAAWRFRVSVVRSFRR